jgi:hypothetical protein
VTTKKRSSPVTLIKIEKKKEVIILSGYRGDSGQPGRKKADCHSIAGGKEPLNGKLHKS